MSSDPRFQIGDVVDGGDGRPVTVVFITEDDGEGWVHLWHDGGEGDGKSHGGGAVSNFRLHAPVEKA